MPWQVFFSLIMSRVLTALNILYFDWLINRGCYIAGLFRPFFHYSRPIHWLVLYHMTSNNEIVSRQMPWACNIVKTMTSNGKQFTVTQEVLTVVAYDRRWPDVVAGSSAHFSRFAFVFFCSITNHLMTWGTVNFVSRESQCFPLLCLGKDWHSPEQNSLFPLGPVIKC